LILALYLRRRFGFWMSSNFRFADDFAASAAAR
jgi:hypothetical protein